MSQPLLSLCMIVRNEEENLPRCLNSVQGVVDEIIIVDTGSSDRTVEIAKSFNAKVFHLPWKDDFSEPRNLSINHASGQWILVLDADEELMEKDKDKVRPSLLKTKAEGLNWKIKNLYNYTPPSYEIGLSFRVFRNNPLYRYKGSIHEQMTATILNHSPEAFFETQDICIIHYGYQQDEVNKKKKKSRNLRILKKEMGATTKDIYPNNNFFHYNIGMEYFRLGQIKKAYYHFSEAQKGLPLNSAFAPKLVRYITSCLAKLKRSHQALEHINEAISNYPDFIDLYFDRALLYHNQKKYSKAIEDLCYCLEAKEIPEYYFPLNGINSFRSYYHLGLIFEELQDFQQALYAYKSALQSETQFNQALEGIVRVLKNNDFSDDEIETKLNQEFYFEDKSSFVLLWNIFFKYGMYKKSLNFLNKADASSDNSESNYYRGITLIKLGRYSEALESLLKIAENSVIYNSAMINTCFAYWVMHDLKKSSEIISIIIKLKINPYLTMIYPLFQKLLEGHKIPFPKLSKRKIIQYNNFIVSLVDSLLEVNQLDKAKLAIKMLIPRSKNYFSVLNLFLKHNFLNEAKDFLAQKDSSQLSIEESNYLQAKIEEKKSNYSTAIEYYTQAIDANPAIEDYYLKVGTLLQKESKEILEEGIKKFPQSSTLKKALPNLDIYGGLRG